MGTIRNEVVSAMSALTLEEDFSKDEVMSHLKTIMAMLDKVAGDLYDVNKKTKNRAIDSVIKGL